MLKKSLTKYFGVGILFALIGMCGCQDQNVSGVSSPLATAPQLADFFAYGGLSEQIGVYYKVGDEFFQVQVPAGDYLLTYVTDWGSFYVVFRAAAKAIVTTGLQKGDVVHEATVFKGTVAATAIKMTSGPVSVFSEFGARDGWETLFAKDPNVAGNVLIGGLVTTYTPGVELKLVIPRPGHYLLKYTSNLGVFQVEFRTTKWYETKSIPLQPGEEIREANLFQLEDNSAAVKRVLFP